MKKVVSVLCCLGIFFASIAFTISLCGRSFVSDALVGAVENEIKLEEQMEEVILRSLGNVDENTTIQIQEISKKISEDQEVQKAMRNFIDIAIKDLISQEIKGDDGNYNEILKAKALTYADELSALTSGTKSVEEVKKQLNDNLSNNAIDEYYKDVMELTQMDASEQQEGMFSLLNALQGSPLFYGSLGMMILLTISIILLNKEHFKFLIALGITYTVAAISAFILAGLFTLLMNGILSEIQPSQTIAVSNSMIMISGFVYSLIGGVSFTTRAIINKK